MEKVLSIIIPTYNMEKYLRKCLDSLIIEEELMSRFEALIINDGSKDLSSEIAHEYESQYSNTFRVIDKENGNYGSCINRGLKEAVGKYIKVLDADDYFDTCAFKEYINFLWRNDADLVLTDFSIVNDSYKVQKDITFSLNKVKCFTFDEYIEKYPIGVQMHAVTYRLNNLRKINYVQTEGISYTDQEWIHYPMVTVKKILYQSLPLYQYLVGREGQTADVNVIKKSMNHHEICLYSMIRSLNHISDGIYYDYLMNRILHTMSFIYDSYLFKFRDLNIEKLQEFDKNINKENSVVYSNSNKIYFSKLLPIRYIQIWRKNTNKRLGIQYAYTYKLSCLLTRLIHGLKKII